MCTFGILLLLLLQLEGNEKITELSREFWQIQDLEILYEGKQQFFMPDGTAGKTSPLRSTGRLQLHKDGVIAHQGEASLPQGGSKTWHVSFNRLGQTKVKLRQHPDQDEQQNFWNKPVFSSVLQQFHYPTNAFPWIELSFTKDGEIEIGNVVADGQEFTRLMPGEKKVYLISSDKSGNIVSVDHWLHFEGKFRKYMEMRVHSFHSISFGTKSLFIPKEVSIASFQTIDPKNGQFVFRDKPVSTIEFLFLRNNLAVNGGRKKEDFEVVFDKRIPIVDSGKQKVSPLALMPPEFGEIKNKSIGKKEVLEAVKKARETVESAPHSVQPVDYSGLYLRLTLALLASIALMVAFLMYRKQRANG